MPERIKDPSRDIDGTHETDVLVAGFGPDGLVAANGAARAGVSATFPERFPGKAGYSIYFGGIVMFGLLGTLVDWRLHITVSKRNS